MRTAKWLYLTLAGMVASACETRMPSEPGALVPKTVAEDSSLPAIDMNGTRFHLETFGSPANPAIVFLHGGPGGDYRGMLRLKDRYNGYSLADEYYLVFWDQRGTGLSQRENKSTLTVAQYVADLDSLVGRYSPGKPVLLIGESWGGMYATRYINEFPQKVAGAVLIEPGPMDSTAAKLVEDGMFDLDMGAEWLNDFAWSSGFFTANDHARMDYERMLGAKVSQPRFHESMVDPSPNWRLGAAANRYLAEEGQDGNGHYTYDFTTHLSAYTTPVLFVAGSLSEVLGPSLQQLQVQKYPSATLEVVDGAGHDVAWVRTSEVLTLIRAYLDARKGGI